MATSGEAMIQKIHHVGVAVHSLDEALKFYGIIMGLPMQLQRELPDQGVRAARLTIGDSDIELLEPLSAESPVGRFLKSRGEGLHHICLQTDDIEGEMETLKSKGVALIDDKPREGLVGRVCFLHPNSNGRVLVELAQP